MKTEASHSKAINLRRNCASRTKMADNPIGELQERSVIIKVMEPTLNHSGSGIGLVVAIIRNLSLSKWNHSCRSQSNLFLWYNGCSLMQWNWPSVFKNIESIFFCGCPRVWSTHVLVHGKASSLCADCALPIFLWRKGGMKIILYFIFW